MLKGVLCIEFLFFCKLKGLNPDLLKTQPRVEPTDKLSPGYSNEPKAIAHICVASEIQTRVRCIGFNPSNATGLPPPLVIYIVLISLLSVSFKVFNWQYFHTFKQASPINRFSPRGFQIVTFTPISYHNQCIWHKKSSKLSSYEINISLFYFSRKTYC